MPRNNSSDDQNLLTIGSFFLSVFLIVLFGLKDILILLSGEWPHLYPVVNTSLFTFEEVYCYLPFATHFSLATPLPVAPLAFPAATHPSLFPALTVFINGIIYQWISFANTDIYFLLMHTLLPLISFWILVLIYNRYVSKAWAVLLAFFGVTFFNDFSSLRFIADFLLQHGDVLARSSLLPLEISRVPFPSLSFVIFIAIFYFSTQTYKVSLRRSIVLTILWSLNLYLYLYNFVAGIMFWFFYLIFAHMIQPKSSRKEQLWLKLFWNFIVVVICILPYFLTWWDLSTHGGSQALGKLGIYNREAGIIVNDWGIMLSYVLPIAVTILLVWVYCGDYFELFYKFTPIFILIGVEIIILNLHLIFGSFFQPHLFSVRIGNFFCRYLYYLPIIYFFATPFKSLFHSDWKNQWAQKIHDIINNCFIKFRTLIAAFGILCISFVVVVSSFKYYQMHSKLTAGRMRIVEELSKEAIRKTPAGAMVVSEDLAVNLFLPVFSKHPSLFVNSFNNNLSSDDIIERIVLYARIFNWDEKRFIEFLLPNEELSRNYRKNNFVLTDETLADGFGYWLVWHHRVMTKEDLASYQDKILKMFRNMDVSYEVDKYNVKVIQSFGEISRSLKIRSFEKDRFSNFYYLDI